MIQLSAVIVSVQGSASCKWLCQTGIQNERLYIILSGLTGQHKLAMQQLQELDRRQTYLMQFLYKIYMAIRKQGQG